MSKFCPQCGFERTTTAKFCAGCGKAFPDEVPVASAPLKTTPTPQMTPLQSVPAAPSRPIPSSTTAATDWQVVVGNQLPSAASAAADGPAAMTETAAGPPLRGQVSSLLIMSATDWVAAVSTQDSAALNLVWLRAILTAISVAGGLIAGSKRGFCSRLTLFSSLILAAVQSTSLFNFGARILANPGWLNGLLPNVITQSLSFLAACRTAWIARK